MELFLLVVTGGVYPFDGHRSSLFQVDSQVDAWPVRWYRRLSSFFKDIQQGVIFSGDPVSYVLVFVVFLVFYRQFGANVDSF